MSKYFYDPTGFFSRKKPLPPAPIAIWTSPEAIGPSEAWVDVYGLLMPEPTWTHKVETPEESETAAMMQAVKELTDAE